MPDERSVDPGEQIVPDSPARVFAQRPGEREIVHDTVPDAIKLERLTEKKQHREFLEDQDATPYLRLSNALAPAERQIDIPSLLSKLSSLLPGDRQPERRARKLAWQL